MAARLLWDTAVAPWLPLHSWQLLPVGQAVQDWALRDFSRREKGTVLFEVRMLPAWLHCPKAITSSSPNMVYAVHVFRLNT